MKTDAEIFGQELSQPLVEVLTAGNHLATILLGRVDCFPRGLPHYECPLDPNDDRTRQLLKGDMWDIWIAWRSIMRLRDAMKRVGLLDA